MQHKKEIRAIGNGIHKLWLEVRDKEHQANSLAKWLLAMLLNWLQKAQRDDMWMIWIQRKEKLITFTRKKTMVRTILAATKKITLAVPISTIQILTKTMEDKAKQSKDWLKNKSRIWKKNYAKRTLKSMNTRNISKTISQSNMNKMIKGRVDKYHIEIPKATTTRRVIQLSWMTTHCMINRPTVTTKKKTNTTRKESCRPHILVPILAQVNQVAAAMRVITGAETV